MIHLEETTPTRIEMLHHRLKLITQNRDKWGTTQAMPLVPLTVGVKAVRPILVFLLVFSSICMLLYQVNVNSHTES